NGEMRPAGVRGLPGCAIASGERIGIHAGAPLGAVVATAVVTDALPIVSGDAWMWSDLPLVAVTDMRPPHYKSCHPYPALVRFTAPDETGVDVSDELPLGDYTPGRWAWLLDDVRPLAEPVPCKG